LKFKPIIVLVAIIILVSTGVCYAASFRAGSGNPLDTPAGYVITIEGETGTLDYDDTSGNPKPQIINTTLETVVTSEYGVISAAVPFDWDGTYYINTSPGIPVTWMIFLTSEGNTSFDMRLTLEAFGASGGFTYAGGANNWQAYMVSEGSNVGGTLEVTIPDDDDIFFDIVIWPATQESDSPAQSSGTINVHLDTYGLPDLGGSFGDYYEGGNGYRYAGGVNPYSAPFKANIYAPLMLLTRESYVDAPTSYTQGGSHEAVPGAVITYTLEYNNVGNGTAESVIILGAVPNNCNAVHVNASTTEVINVYLNPAKSTATGWTVCYSTIAYPNDVYGDRTDWTQIGTIESDSDYWKYPTNFSLTVTYVKFEKASVAAAENETLTWGVAIR